MALGVDGCAGGWLACDASGSIEVYETFADLVTSNPNAHCLIDIPIGLPDDRPRDLELQARKLLAQGEGPSRGSSVFPVPSREAVYADSYLEACAINQRQFGKKLSKQSWYICAKIREVDQLLCGTPGLYVRIFESHPELAFRLLNGRPLAYGKKTTAGQAERISLLSAYWPDAVGCYEAALRNYRRRDVARDDILDAMVLAVTGRMTQFELTGEVTSDERGVPVRMRLPAVSSDGFRQR